jgi:hypothetical protein
MSINNQGVVDECPGMKLTGSAILSAELLRRAMFLSGRDMRGLPCGSA